ncbi:hypothetical protein QMK19_03815 [Streptomyces sp. H10-C2]|uniref:hypothetical protein n=1 Tax=unclassified Streptomyces TaxID=2593676 RepID=UPI0024B9C483|nr:MULTISPECIES: hypothetical protein [unclassified Streptomyces]MDJ0345225.1 hypothetical protein [Streptomyces sp. PH10-H1]MDJ0368829.1 hypothetical protein [Streptomyces sp. H10-C2]
MPPTPPPGPAAPSAAEANDALRRYAAGRIAWGPRELAELARLRAAYLAAVRAGLVEAA